MTGLPDALTEVRKRIDRYRGTRKLNEQNTKATLIEPVLRSLGWDLEDLEEVQREYKRKRRDKPVDYALLLLREPRLFIEAKALGQDLADRKWINQIMGYAAVAGVEWIVLTNGDEYRLYNARAPVHVDEKLFRSFKVSEETPAVETTLRLLARERLQDNRLEVLWKGQFVDRQVHRALNDLFDNDPDPSLVRLLGRKTKNLSPKDVRASLARAQMTITFPVESDIDKTQTKPPKKKRTSRKGRTRPVDQTRGQGERDQGARVSIAQLIDSGLIRPPMELVKSYKGSELRARIERDGSVRVGDQVADSPSTAAGIARASVIGLREDGKPPHTNGWTFWKFRQPDGSLAELDALRQAHVRRTRLRKVE